MRHSDKFPAKSPPAYFLSLTVENIRCFGPKQTLDLSDGNGRPAPWTIILGDNGFGKTTLLECLAGMQPISRSYKQGSSSKEENNDQVHILLIPALSETFSEIMALTRGIPSQIECSIFYGTKISSDQTGNTLKRYAIDMTEENFMSSSSVEIAKGENISQLICYAYGAKRQISSTSLAPKPSRINDRLFLDETPLINAEEWYLQADYASKRSSSPSEKSRRLQQIEAIKSALISLLPSVENIEIVESKISGLDAHVEVKTPFGRVHIQDLSLGYRTLIAWIVDLAHRLFERYPKSENPLAEPAVVLVDEIDLHLHPRFQRILMNYLTGLFPNTQFIATAHSPLVVQASSNANIVLLRREGDHVVIDNDVENIENWRVDQILTSDLFGLKSARQLEIEEYEVEREAILGKPKLTARDKEKLEFLESKIAALPIGETRGDMKAMDIVRRLAKEIERVQENSK